MTARLRVVRLPGATPFHRPFMVVIDRATDMLEPYETGDGDDVGVSRWEDMCGRLGARAVLVTECEIDIPQLDGEIIDGEAIE